MLEVYCQMLYDLDQDQALLIFTATPGSDSHDKLQLLSVIGAHTASGGASIWVVADTVFMRCSACRLTGHGPAAAPTLLDEVTTSQ
jgi:hypothetical protein